MTRNNVVKLLGLNVGIAVTNTIIFSPGLLGVQLGGGSALATAFGSAALFVSITVFFYGNYQFLVGKEQVVQTNELNTTEDYLEALRAHKGKKTFEQIVILLIEQIERLQKKKEKILSILGQIFNPNEMSYQKFAGVIMDVEDIFYLNLKSIINKLNAFDEDDYNLIRKKHAAQRFSQQFVADKFKVYNEYITFMKDSVEDNEEILLKLDKLLLEIAGLNSMENGQIEQMPGMIEIDNLIKQTKLYK
ncbi:MAG: hypothetical protein APF81_18620 [Desulfosporosinus sp. BRH_c37]|nr:MAG: hypothetical protein APF81_18620 [Desulfosporosinus sp. BRH_c37]